MKVWSLLPLLILVSCLSGKDSGKSEKKDQGISCLCTELPDWTVISKTKPFPKNFMITYEGSEIVNTCTGRNVPVRENANNEYMIKYEFMVFPKTFFEFEIADLGDNCSGNTVIYSDSPQYSTAIVTPEGQKPDHQVYVYLD